MNIIEMMEAFEMKFRREEIKCAEHSLVLPTGKLIVAPNGVTAHMLPPFSKLSRHYPWKYVPASFAALRVLATGEQCSTIEMVERFLGLKQRIEIPANPEKRKATLDTRDADQWALEETDTWCKDVDRIVRWGVGLADVCPDPSVAKALALLPGLDPSGLDRYIMSWMG